MSFPSSIDSFAGFTSTDTLQHDNHAGQHNQEQSAIVAIENKIGTGASTPTSTSVLVGNGAGTSAWGQVNLSNQVTGQLPSSNALSILETIYPIGCIYTETTGVNPNTTFGFGSWTAFGSGRVLIGNGTSDQAFTAGATGGESNHTLTSNEMPSHTHTVTDPGHFHTPGFVHGTSGTFGLVDSNTASSSGTTNTNSATTGITNGNTGGGASHNNLQPYIVVYFWQRTA